MNATIQPFQNELTPEERRLFETKATRAGRRPGMHLKHLLFGDGLGLQKAERGKLKAEKPKVKS